MVDTHTPAIPSPNEGGEGEGKGLHHGYDDDDDDGLRCLDDCANVKIRIDKIGDRRQ